MRTIPITPEMLTGDVLEAAHRRYLDGADLAAWAEALLHLGIESDAIIEAVGNPDMHWQRVESVFARMCKDIGLSENISMQIPSVKQEAMIAEYRRGHRQAAELLHRFDDLRKQIGFPEPIEFRLLEDNDDGTNDSGYYGMESRKHGAELNDVVRRYLATAGIQA